jgi:hypothetical protein
MSRTPAQTVDHPQEGPMRVPSAFRVAALFLVPGLVLASRGESLADNATVSAQETPPAAGSLRPRPSPRPVERQTPEATITGDGVRGSAPLATPDPAVTARSDDPVLRWLPEMSAASAATGTPLSLIAGVMRVESGGDPETVSPQGAQGLMQVMPAELGALGIPQTLWRDPATNILAGAAILAQRASGGWEAAVAYYFGIGCDAYGTCTQQYAMVVLSWANAYAAILGDPIVYDVSMIPEVPSAPSLQTAPAQQTGGQAEATDGAQTNGEPAPPGGADQSWNNAEPAAPAPPTATSPPEPPAAPTADTSAWQNDD